MRSKKDKKRIGAVINSGISFIKPSSCRQKENRIKTMMKGKNSLFKGRLPPFGKSSLLTYIQDSRETCLLFDNIVK
jgi:hypothetical protein